MVLVPEAAGQGVVVEVAPHGSFELRVDQNGSNGGNREELNTVNWLYCAKRRGLGPRRGRKPKSIGFMIRLRAIADPDRVAPRWE